MANNTLKSSTSYQLDYRSLSITLLGANNRTMTGTVNLSAVSDLGEAKARVDTYDDSGAAYYVCAVILVYGLSIVSLIGSLAKKKMKDNKVEQDEVQIHNYLHKVPDLREKSARDNYRQLKKNVIKLVEERSPSIKRPTPTSAEQEPKNAQPPSGHHSDQKKDTRSSLDQRQPTPRYYKGKGHGQRRAPPENQLLLSGENIDEYEEDSGLGTSDKRDLMEKELGVYPRSMQRSVPVERLTLTHEELYEPEEKITVVRSALPSESNGEAATNSGDNTLLQGEHLERPRYRWSLGADGNIWIMQVDSKGESKPAEPPKVDSLPAPPSPGYVCPGVYDYPEYASSYSVENEKQGSFGHRRNSHHNRTTSQVGGSYNIPRPMKPSMSPMANTAPPAPQNYNTLPQYRGMNDSCAVPEPAVHRQHHQLKIPQRSRSCSKSRSPSPHNHRKASSSSFGTATKGSRSSGGTPVSTPQPMEKPSSASQNGRHSEEFMQVTCV